MPPEDLAASIEQWPGPLRERVINLHGGARRRGHTRGDRRAGRARRDALWAEGV